MKNLRRFLVALVLPALILGAFAVSTVVAGGNAGKVTICHFPPGNPENFQEITVDWSAVPAHVSEHGDIVGGCNQG